MVEGLEWGGGVNEIEWRMRVGWEGSTEVQGWRGG